VRDQYRRGEKIRRFFKYWLRPASSKASVAVEYTSASFEDRSRAIVLPDHRRYRLRCRHGASGLPWSPGTPALTHLLLFRQCAQDQIRPRAHADFRQDLDFVTNG
jgi:hypothetical protein